MNDTCSPFSSTVQISYSLPVEVIPYAYLLVLSSGSSGTFLIVFHKFLTTFSHIVHLYVNFTPFIVQVITQAISLSSSGNGYEPFSI
jgi:hypothetical protein